MLRLRYKSSLERKVYFSWGLIPLIQVKKLVLCMIEGFRVFIELETLIKCVSRCHSVFAVCLSFFFPGGDRTATRLYL